MTFPFNGVWGRRMCVLSGVSRLHPSHLFAFGSHFSATTSPTFSSPIASLAEGLHHTLVFPPSSRRTPLSSSSSLAPFPLVDYSAPSSRPGRTGDPSKSFVFRRECCRTRHWTCLDPWGKSLTFDGNLVLCSVFAGDRQSIFSPAECYGRESGWSRWTVWRSC